MKKITRTNALKAIKESDKIMIAVAATKTNPNRTFVFKSLPKDAVASKMSKLGYITVLDVVKNQPRNINAQTLSSIWINDVKYDIK